MSTSRTTPPPGYTDGDPTAIAPPSGPDGGPPERRGYGGLLHRFADQPVLNTILLLLCIATAIVAYQAVGPASGATGTVTRTTTVKDGVVQSTVSGSGNIASTTQLNLGFATAGTVTHIYVSEGQHVTQGQLIATLDPQSAEVALQEARAKLKAAEASLVTLEENGGETTSGGSSGATGATGSTGSTGPKAAVASAGRSVYAAYQPGSTTTTPASSPSSPASTAPAATTPATTTTPSSGGSGTTAKERSSSGTSGGSTRTTPATTTTSSAAATSKAATTTATKQSEATREANLASSRAAVKSDRLAVQSAEQAVSNTRLYAPSTGTIVSLSGAVGQAVSGTGNSKASSSAGTSSSSSGTGTGGAGGTGSSSKANSGASSSSSSGGSGSTSSAFAVLSDLERLQLVVSLSESEINKVHVGQIATVTIEALSGKKAAAHVVAVAQTPSSTSGAVSYGVTFQLDQPVEGLKVGMSAAAEVVVEQAEGLNVPTSAIKGGSVTVVRGGRHVTQPVTTGLAGDSSTIVTSGVSAGETIVLPTVSTTSGTSSGSSSRLGSALRSAGAGGFVGGGLGGGGFAGGGPPGGP